MDLLRYKDHRPWEMPNQPWVMYQAWKKLLFMHWEIDPELIKPLIPEGLELDLFEGKAWIAVVPFEMNDVHPRFTFPILGLSYFLELNVRTYVKKNNKAGVFFLSLEANNPIAVRIARKIFYLPYMDAIMSNRHKNDIYHYSSLRTHHNEPSAKFEANYKPTSEVFYTSKGTLEHWLTERYCLYAKNDKGNIYIGEIHHKPWALQKAECEIITNTMTLPYKITLPDTEPLLHYAENIEVVVWFPEKCLD